MEIQSLNDRNIKTLCSLTDLYYGGVIYRRRIVLGTTILNGVTHCKSFHMKLVP